MDDAAQITKSVVDFVKCWLNTVIEQTGKLTVFKSGFTQLGISFVEIVLTRSNGITPSGVQSSKTTLCMALWTSSSRLGRFELA